MLIAGILDLSKIGVDKSVLNHDSFDLKNLLNQRIDLIVIVMRVVKKGISS